ncbi:uncharacterized protein LOC119723512 isoform X2 [Patiria miniata]|uniref:Uncharacterized protein n=1 Tax=Patiria miniata TaxID=46514 RepID=A0A913ZEC2_PATMI|nr:uncharacterized protein LOC119723512 isoform X1 [Patiria miniata]XP_038050137.1 uncharacterized protein LOC119723512 isoform X2 [Patiria miniata]
MKTTTFQHHFISEDGELRSAAMGKYVYMYTSRPVITVKSKETTPNVGRISVLLGMVLVVTCTTLAFICSPFSPVNQMQVLQHAHVPRSHDSGEAEFGQIAPAYEPNPKNILYIFTGRWRYLRINFAYIYRSLRQNGGVLDRVYYVMIQYDDQTLSKLTELTDSANKYLGEKVFELKIRNPNEDTTRLPKDVFPQVAYEILAEIVKYPERKYFKMDDDIVYIHPGAFRQLIEQQNTSECFLHFANIGGANWRSSYIHQEMGVFDDKEINPNNLRFEFNPKGNPRCGFKSAECAQLALRGFLHHYENKSLDRFQFDGRYPTTERGRYNINLLLLDVNIINFNAMLDSTPIGNDYEFWLTQKYSSKVKNPNCIVGGAFVVHFAYSVNEKEIRKQNFAEKFETIAFNDLVKFLPGEFQNILALNATSTA